MSLPIEDLIDVLLARTRDGGIQWKEVNSQASRYYARRGSGMVVVSGPATSLKPWGIGPGEQAPTYVLDVNDERGKTIEHVEYTEPSLVMAAISMDTPALRNVATLFGLVKEQVTHGNATMRSLVAEFDKPEPEDPEGKG